MTSFNHKDYLILVVDDISQNLQIIGEMLERSGYETTFATSGQQALDRVQSARPDLILLDLMMPGMNGIEVCEKLKSHPDFSHIPIIFITASNEKYDLVKAFKKGAADYITKPFYIEEVLSRIENQLINQNLKKRLQQQNQKLQQEIEVRRHTETALKQAKEAAETANRAKSTFLANMSHELRTPLNAVLGFAQLISYGPNLTAEQKKHLAIIRRSGEHLLNLINEVLDLSKIESGRITINNNAFNFVELILDLQEMFELKAREKNLILEFKLSPEVPYFIESDRLKIRQILINILGNAIKFTKKGEVHLNISAKTETTQTLIEFEISDTGIGISPEELHKLFQPFVQTQSGIALAEGTGLGLAISHKYVQILGGNISVDSQLNRGTIFKFQIPVNLASETKIEPKIPQRHVLSLAPNQEVYRILVVDDNLSNRQLMLQMLTNVGFDVQEAVNGPEAIEMWLKFQPHLIWIDIQIPIINGCEVARKIKANFSGKSTIIIAVTAHIFAEEKNVILASGCDDIVYKPIEESIIFEKMAQYLKVQYIYENLVINNQSQNNQDISPPFLDLKILPKSLLIQIKQAALALDEEMLQRLITQISPQANHLAKAIQECIDNFEFHKILQAIDNDTLSPVSTAKVVPEWIGQIKQAVRCADLEIIDSLIVTIQNHNPTLAEQLQSYLDNFEYHKILNLIDELEDKEKHRLDF